tara:strand:- start:1612 stop:2286 length:675 start_codon:yes stop_codon:yes gene_type:complete
MNLKATIASVPFLLGSLGPLPVQSQELSPVQPEDLLPTQYESLLLLCLNPYYYEEYKRLKPFGDLVSTGEGDYNSVNRGYAGDTPGGIKSLTGKTFENYTVGQVMAYQQRWLYAVGRYQLIPSTLRFAVANSKVSKQDMFTDETQDKLMAALVLHKRPAIGGYIKGEHDSITLAMDEAAREWASVEFRNGRGYYDGIGGNRANISRVSLEKVLKEIKKGWHVEL